MVLSVSTLPFLCQSLRRHFGEGCEAIVYSVWRYDGHVDFEERMIIQQLKEVERAKRG
jgi:hypothetical protein